LEHEQYSHIPVLLAETLEILNPKLDGLYFDTTFGRGGHAKAMLARLGPEGRLIVLDRDPEAIAQAHTRYRSEKRITVVHSGFANLDAVARQLDVVPGEVDGFLFDLGVSSPQIDDSDRGFSFMHDGPLDMRMDSSQGMTAAQWLNEVTEEELMEVIATLGEERFARRVARAILGQRPLHSTAHLARTIEEAIPRRNQVRGHHPATRSFQAIRMHINDELGQLQTALPQAFELLREGGRMAVISFHSLEDRIVKGFVYEKARKDSFPLDFPVTHAQQQQPARAVGGLKRPGAEELELNPRARSARLRGLEKLVHSDA